ncbi:2,5-diketo-D-gluconate reductase A [Friedmanniella luteola]|uniref:2,5-diketo-D-gluconate reductase A n=1 Tax=Friedmanniella luteola TaxID=546871 RepID=A0A1H2A140_9ACTN|nr:aldo/keto reductase [Friedmanniella luteola]SDT39640.1 2,5-diketo-D-gluconate reductase A [Friedmanniella luteola]
MPATPTVPLRNGLALPVIGLGTWPLRGADAAAAVRTALETGYRLVDCAENYRNEDGVGQGIRDSAVPREDVVITTKFNREWHSVDGVRQAWRASTERLGVEYLDVFMVHWPNPGQDRYVEAVRGLAALLEDGSIRAVGVSNFTPAHLQRLEEEAGLVPDLNQIQLSPYAARRASQAYHREHGIVTESWSPIGGSADGLRSDPVIADIAAEVGRTPTQVVLRWHVQTGLVAVPKSADPGRIAENLDVFDFALDDEQLARVDALDRGEVDVADPETFGH